MALDTRNKRASALGLGLAPLRVGPSPDGSLVAADRLHLAYLYAGIGAGVDLVPEPPYTVTVSILVGAAGSAGTQ